MVIYSYRISDGRFLRGWPNTPPYDPATESVQVYPEHLRPNLRTERFDGTSPTNKRNATAQEIADYDAERLDDRAKAELDGVNAKMLKATVIWICQKLSIAPATARQEIFQIYKGV